LPLLPPGHLIIPGLAVSVRRLHDVGKSGWMYFIVLIPLVGVIWLLVLMLTDSNPGENQYGVNPKDARLNDSTNKTNVVTNSETVDLLILLVVIWMFFRINTFFIFKLSFFEWRRR